MLTLFIDNGIPYVRREGTSICLNCPLPPDCCDQLKDPSEARRMKDRADCLITYAYQNKITLKEAEHIFNRTIGLGLDKWFYYWNIDCLSKKLEFLNFSNYSRQS